MASTLKPFRQYNEHEVLNLFSFQPTSDDAHGSNCVNMIADGGEHTWDAGRLLVSNEVAMKTTLTDKWDPVTQNDGGMQGDTAETAWATAIKGYLGANYNAGRSGYENVSPDGSHVGLFGNSNATFTAKADSLVAATEAAVGISLRSTLAYDENNEKLMYYTNKQDELQAVLPGDAVPCLRRGLIAMVVDGITANTDAGSPVHGLDASTTKGGLVSLTTDESAIGEIVAVMDVKAKIALVQIDV